MFLASATPQLVWTAKKFAIGHPPSPFPELPGPSTPVELNRALLDYFFPGGPAITQSSILLPFNNSPESIPEEVVRALARSSPSSAPGPDVTPKSVWKRINTAARHIILKFVNPVVLHGFHPPSPKKADRILQDKPGKPSYASPSSFSIIVLLQTFSKILERMMNGRLSSMAGMTGLLNPYQCGSLSGLSCSDQYYTLTDEI